MMVGPALPLDNSDSDPFFSRGPDAARLCDASTLHQSNESHKDWSAAEECAVVVYGRSERRQHHQHDDVEEEEEDDDDDGDSASSSVTDPVNSLSAIATSLSIWDEVIMQARLAGPITVLNLLWQCRFSVATMFLGHLGNVKLAGCSLAIVLANLTGFCCLTALSEGIEILCGKAYGGRRFNELSLILQRGLLLLSTACILTTVCWFFLPPVLLSSGQSAEVVAETARFLSFLVPDLVACAGVNALGAYLRSQSLTRPIMIGTTLGLIIQIGASSLFVLHLGLGTAGVALALSLCDATIVICLLSSIILFHRESWTGFSRECLRDLRPLLSLSIPAFFAIAPEWWCFELMTVVAGLLPNQAASVASMSIVSNFSYLFFMVPAGVCAAGSIRISNELGAYDVHRARTAVRVAAVLATASGSLGFSMMISLRRVWGRLFTDDAAIIDMVGVMLPLAGLNALAEAPACMCATIARCTGYQAIPAMVVAPIFFLLGLPLGVWLAFQMHLDGFGLWIGLDVAQYCSLITTASLNIAVIDWDAIAKLKTSTTTTTTTIITAKAKLPQAGVEAMVDSSSTGNGNRIHVRDKTDLTEPLLRSQSTGA